MSRQVMRWLAVWFVVVTCSGCGTWLARSDEPDLFEAEVLTLARETRGRVSELTRDAQAATPGVGGVAGAPVSGASASTGVEWPAPFKQVIFLDWYGEVDPVVKAVASFLGWDFRVSGVSTVPVLVIVRGEITVGRALEMIGEQSGGRVKVVVDLDARTIEVVR